MIEIFKEIWSPASMRDDTALWHLHGYCCCCRLSWPVCHGSLPDPTCAVCTRADPPVYQHLVYNLLPLEPWWRTAVISTLCTIKKLNRAAKVLLLHQNGAGLHYSLWWHCRPALLQRYVDGGEGGGVTAAFGITSPSMTVLMILPLSSQCPVLL